MLYLLALVVGGAAGAWLYQRTPAVAAFSRQSMAISGLIGAVAALLVMWLFQVGIGGALNTAGTILVLTLVTACVVSVVTIAVLSVRKADDVRIRSKLRWERKHKRVPGLRSSDDD
jgi:low affinity Fe/Cu permease